jgi:hypothetical protein
MATEKWQEKHVSIVNNAKYKQADLIRIGLQFVFKASILTDSPCKFKYLKIFCNANLFFMEAVAEVREHSNHRKDAACELLLGSKLLNDHILTDQRTMAYASTSGHALASGLRNKHKLHVTKPAMSNAAQSSKISPLFGTDYLRNMHDAESVRQLLLHSDCKAIMLSLHDPSIQSDPPTVSLSVCDTVGEVPVTKEVCDVATEIVQEWVHETKSTKMANQDTLICLGWASKDMIRLANAFPQSLSVDATHKTVNIDGLSLLTVTTKDAFGKTNVVLRFWIPNQKQWMFKYILQQAIPNILGHDICKKVQAFISDGDEHLIAMITQAMSTIYINARFLPCAWHLIDCPMSKMRSQFHTHSHITEYFTEWICRLIQRWLYSWMRPSGGIYSRDEFQVSKAILLCMLKSELMAGIFTKHGLAKLEEYVLDRLKYEHKFLSCDSLNIFALEIYSNSAHEGTNSGAKRNIRKVHALQSLGMSTHNLVEQDKQTHVERQRQCHSEYVKTRNWTDTWEGLTSNTAAIMTNMHDMTRLVLSSEWGMIGDSISFYVLAPNDIERNSFLLHEQKQKCILEKRKMLEVEYDSEWGSDNSSADIETTEQHKIKRLKGVASMKQLKKMNMIKLLDGMTAVEKDIASFLTNDANKKKKLAIPEIASSFIVTMKKYADSPKWYLQCSCSFANRFGGICMHMFHVHDQYLAKIGCRKWGYKDMCFIHWDIYSYVSFHLHNENMLTNTEQAWLKKFLSWNATDYYGPACEFNCEKFQGRIHPLQEEIVNELSLMEAYDNNSGESALKWSFRSACDRVTNYDSSFVRKCIEEMESNMLDKFNTTMYQSTMSQPDGWEEFGVPFETDNKETTYHDFDGIDLDISIEDSRKRENRKAEITKNFFEVFNSVDLKDDVCFEFMKRQLQELKQNVRSLNEIGMVRAVNDGKIYFPNSQFGDNCADNITKRSK